MEVQLSWTEKGVKKTGVAVFDDDFPHAGARWQVQGRYLRASLGKDHPLAPGDGKNRVYAHRAVLHWKLGPGPHECALCGWGGLRFDADRTAELDEYLVVDHRGHQSAAPTRFDNRAEVIRPACFHCNDSREIYENLGIPFDQLAMLPPSQRPALRVKVKGGPTPAALALRDQIKAAELSEQQVLEAAKLALERQQLEPGEGHPEITEEAAVLAPAAAALVEAVEEANAEAAVEAQRSDRWYRRLARRLFGRRPTVDDMVYGPGERFVTWDDIADMDAVLNGTRPVKELLRDREVGE